MELKLNGCTRIVILIGRYAIKLPNWAYEHIHFMEGCYANCTERHVTKSMRYIKEPQQPLIAPTLFCSWLGLLSIQKRAKPLNRELTDSEVEIFRELTKDIKKDNFGILSGQLVCIDYA